MAEIKDNQHFWTYLPELGPDYAYCDRCKKVENLITGKRMSYSQALKEIEKNKQENKK